MSAFTADPRLLASIARRRAPELVRDPSLPRAIGLRVHVEPEAWGAGYLAVHERELPPELYADLRELSPQALLRDLHRPVVAAQWVARTPLVDAVDFGARRA